MRMSRAIARRIRRLEQATGSRDNNELVELELSDEAKALLRETLTELGFPPEEIEATVNERRLVPKSLLRPLSPAARAILDERPEA
jgi:division protein CdvB (Snf7/Vps24/ESCRT-III family)